MCKAKGESAGDFLESGRAWCLGNGDCLSVHEGRGQDDREQVLVTGREQWRRRTLKYWFLNPYQPNSSVILTPAGTGATYVRDCVASLPGGRAAM
jgi:hypothetical protein